MYTVHHEFCKQNTHAMFSIVPEREIKQCISNLSNWPIECAPISYSYIITELHKRKKFLKIWMFFRSEVRMHKRRRQIFPVNLRQPQMSTQLRYQYRVCCYERNTLHTSDRQRTYFVTYFSMVCDATKVVQNIYCDCTERIRKTNNNWNVCIKYIRLVYSMWLWIMSDKYLSHRQESDDISPLDCYWRWDAWLHTMPKMNTDTSFYVHYVCWTFAGILRNMKINDVPEAVVWQTIADYYNKWYR